MRKAFAMASALLVALAMSGPAAGEGALGNIPRDAPAAQAGPPAGPVVRASRIGRLGFAQPAIRASDQDLTALVQFVADGIGRVCAATEVFAWTNAPDSSERAQEVFLGFDQALHIKGYDSVKIDVEPPTEAEARAAHHGILAYSAESRNTNADDARIVFLWYFEADIMHLALCRSEPKKEEPDGD